MNPLDFLRVADTLKDCKGEAEIRTVAGRAYYAVFNLIKLYLAAHQIKLRRREEHRLLPLCIKNSGVEEAKEVGAKVGELRDDRYEADYEMDAHINWGDEEYTSLALVEKACEVARGFQSCRGPALLDGVKKYLIMCCEPITWDDTT
jgi:hypothetical protein